MEPKDVRLALRHLLTKAVPDAESVIYWQAWAKSRLVGDFESYLQTHPLSPSLRNKVALQIIIYKLEQ